MRSLLVQFLLMQALGLPVSAGAWLREAGTSFSAISFSMTYFGDTANAAYLEFGLSDDITVGADLGYFTDRLGTQTGDVTLFLRRPLNQQDTRHKWAYELGVGTGWTDNGYLPHLKTGLSWGRGYQLGDRRGWMATDASAKWELSQNRRTLKLDSTIGFNFTDVTAAMLQLFVTADNGQTYTKLAPSIIVKPRKGSYRLQIGTESPTDDVASTAIKLGLWRDF